MKKLMIAAVAVACGSVFALESANVVGFNTGATGADNNFITVPFASIGYNTADIQSIKLSDGGAGGIGWGTETFSVWEGVPTVVEGSDFFYNDPTLDPSGAATTYYWADADGNKATYPIAPGQGVVINCGEGLTITIDSPIAL